MASGPDTHGLCEEHLSHRLENRALDTALGMGPAQRHRICLSQKPVCSLTPRANQLFFFFVSDSFAISASANQPLLTLIWVYALISCV